MEVIIVRHAESETNKADTIGGDKGAVITSKGQKQAKELAKRLATQHIDTIYSSPFKRALQTIEPLSRRLNQKIQTDDRLVEINWGSFEGKPSVDLQKAVGMLPWEYLDSYSYDLGSYGGESAKEVEIRSRKFLEDLKKLPHQRVIVVTHGGVVRYLYFLLTGQKIKRQPNAQEIIITI